MTRSIAWLAGSTILISACGSSVDGPEHTGGAGGESTFSAGTGAASAGGTGGTSSGTGGGPPEDQAALCRATYEASCDKLAECGPWIITSVYGDLATCKARGLVYCDALVAASGYAPRTVDAAAACVDDIVLMSCHDHYAQQSDACAPVPGTLLDGSACAFDEQCESTFCDGAWGAACGVCTPRVVAGDDCSENYSACERGTICVYGSGSSTCARLGMIGDSCDLSAPCAFTLGCSEGVCTEMVEGAPCGLYQDCGQVGGLYCDAGTCRQLEVGATGEACGTEPEDFCEASGDCHGGICVPHAEDGGPCDGYLRPNGDVFGGCMYPAECIEDTCVLPSASLCRE